MKTKIYNPSKEIVVIEGKNNCGKWVKLPVGFPDGNCVGNESVGILVGFLVDAQEGISVGLKNVGVVVGSQIKNIILLTLTFKGQRRKKYP